MALFLSPFRSVAMAAAGGGVLDEAEMVRTHAPEASETNVADLLKNLNLTAEEEKVLEFSDGEGEEGVMGMEWALVGKVLSPAKMHTSTIHQAVQAPWGNPHGLRIRAIGEKADNLFVAEFAFEQDRDRVRGGSPWIFGKHALIMQDYDERLRPSKIVFDRMDIWVRILNVPLGWMNETRGGRTMGLVGEVKKMDVDKNGKGPLPAGSCSDRCKQACA